MAHTRTCPHDCAACEKAGRWFVGAWKHGGCVVCGQNRGGGIWACPVCWDDLNELEKSEVQKVLKGVKVK